MFFTGNTQVMREQLWIIRGRHPVLWTVPFYVAWRNEDEAEMFSAVPLLRIQQAAVEALLNQRGRQANKLWYVPREELEKIGEVAPGTDPEVFFSWERLRAAQMPQTKPEKRAERDAFLDALYQQGVGQSRDDVEFWWHQFCAHALDWLINKEEPVDMYFIKLYPAPYRIDWKARMRREAMKQHWHGFRPKHYEIKKSDSIRKFLLCPFLLGLSADGVIDRFVEVEHLPFWWKLVKRVERTRLSRLKPLRYAEYVAASVTRFRGVATRLYAAWVAQRRQASASIVASSQAGTFSLTQNIAGIRKKASRHYVNRNAFKLRRRIRLTKMAKSKALPRKNAGVPAVSNVQPPAEDLRNIWGLVPKSRDAAG